MSRPLKPLETCEHFASINKFNSSCNQSEAGTIRPVPGPFPTLLCNMQLSDNNFASCEQLVQLYQTLYIG